MVDDDEWVSNVKRWCVSQQASRTLLASGEHATVIPHSHTHSEDALGYEAAHPMLQARHWPDVVGPI